MNISAVVDDDKKVIGLISIEDILEELVGEIFDEYDIEILFFWKKVHYRKD